MKLQIVPAVLVKNISEFKEQIKNIKNIFPLIQIDVCDNIFVKNKTFKERVEINKLKLPCQLELHLMVKHPEKEILKWEKVKNIYRVYVHVETLKNNFDKINNLIRKNGWQLGLVLNPGTKIDKLNKYLEKIDAVLFMTVHPGTQGQKLIKPVLKKIKTFSSKNKTALISADGGINLENIKQVKKSGVKEFCIGKSLVMTENINTLKKQFEKIIKK